MVEPFDLGTYETGYLSEFCGFAYVLAAANGAQPFAVIRCRHMHKKGDDAPFAELWLIDSA